MKKIRVGVCIPGQPPKNTSVSIHTAGIGRIPHDVHIRLMEMLHSIEHIELHININFRQAYILNGKVYCNGECLNDYDIFFWYCEIDRTIGSYDLEILKALLFDTKVVINPYAFEIGLDKYKAHLVLKRAGVCVADTLLFDTSHLNSIRETVEEWGRVVLKPRLGGFGKGVMLLDSFAQLRDCIEYIHSTTGTNPDKGYLLERFYPNEIEQWVSTTIINGKLVYGYRKRRSKLVELSRGMYKVYDANEIGGEVDVCDVSESHKQEALKAYAAIGAEIIGFDFIFHNNQPILVDENTFPGYYTDIFAQVGLDPAFEFYSLIIDEIEKFRLSY